MDGKTRALARPAGRFRTSPDFLGNRQNAACKRKVVRSIRTAGTTTPRHAESRDLAESDQHRRQVEYSQVVRDGRLVDAHPLREIRVRLAASTRERMNLARSERR